MALKDKLHVIKMSKGENVVSYLTRLSKVKDELSVVGEVVSDPELVRIALKGFSKEWSVFVKCIVGREKLPDWSRLWDDFTQEEIRMGEMEEEAEGTSQENVALVAKGNKKKKNPKVDISKVRCFACNEYGHYAAQCPHKKKKTTETEKQVAATADVANFDFEKEFALVSIVSCGISNSYEFDRTWIVDSGATNHMNGILDSFQYLKEISSGCVVNGTHEVKGVGTVKFQLDLGKTLEVNGVLYTPSLRVNVLSVADLEDDGYTVMFRRDMCSLIGRLKMRQYFWEIGEKTCT